MTFLRTRSAAKTPRPSFEDRSKAIKAWGELFAADTPTGCDSAKTRMAVSIGRGGKMRPAQVFVKNKPKELGLDFIMSPHARIV